MEGYSGPKPQMTAMKNVYCIVLDEVYCTEMDGRTDGWMDGTCLPNALCIKRLYAKLNTIKLFAAKGLRWKLASLLWLFLLLLSVFMYN